MDNFDIGQIKTELFALRDERYRDFQAKLIPTVDKSRIIGVRTPVLRRYAAELKRDGRQEKFLQQQLPLFYYDEMNLYACLLGQERDFDRAVTLTDEFLPHIDNWATCDMLMPQAFKRKRGELWEYVEKWISRSDTYSMRYALVLLLKLYLGEDFDSRGLTLAASVQSDEYYVKMAAAWYFSMALIMQPSAALPYFTERRLEPWVHNKALQKARESHRTDKLQKLRLKELYI